MLLFETHFKMEILHKLKKETDMLYCSIFNVFSNRKGFEEGVEKIICYRCDLGRLC